MNTWTDAVRQHLEDAARPQTDEPAGDELETLSHRELQAEAKRIGLSAAGSSQAIRDRIREAVA